MEAKLRSASAGSKTLSNVLPSTMKSAVASSRGGKRFAEVVNDVRTFKVAMIQSANVRHAEQCKKRAIGNEIPVVICFRRPRTIVEFKI